MKTQTSILLLLLLLLTCGASAQKPEPIPQMGHANDINAAAFALGGKVLISSSRDNVMKVWNSATGELLQTLGDAAFVALSPDGQTLLTVESQRLKLRDLLTGKQTSLSTEPISDEAYSGEYSHQVVAFSADGKRLLRVGPNPLLRSRKAVNGIQVWNLADGSHRFIPLTGDYDYGSAIFSSDGELLIAHNSNSYLPEGTVRKKQGLVRVLKAETGGEVYTIRVPPNEEVQSAFLSPDNKILVTQSQREVSDSKYQTTIIFSDARTGREIRRVTRDGTAAAKLYFSPQGPLSADVSGKPASGNKTDAVIAIRNDTTGKVIHELPVSGTRTGVESISFSPDGTTLAASYSTDDDLEKKSRIQLWDVASGKSLRVIDSKKTEPEFLFFSPDGHLLAGWGAYYSSESLQVWEVEKGNKSLDFAGRRNEVQAIEISPNNKVLVISANSLLRPWSLTTGEPLGPPIRGDFRAFSKDGSMIVIEEALGSEDQRVTKLLDSSGGGERASFKGNFLSLSSDGKRIFTDGPQPQSGITVWDASTGKELRKLAATTGDQQLESRAVSPDGQYLAVVRSGSPKIELISVETGRVLKTMNRLTGPSSQTEYQQVSLTFSPDSKLLASSSGEMWGEHTLRMWRVATGALLYKVAAGAGAGVDVTFSPDGKMMATTGNQISTFDVRTGRSLHTFDVSKYVYETAEFGTTASFSPDGKILLGIVGGGRSVALLWDAPTGREIPLFRASHDEASTVGFSSDGKYLASVGRDGIVRFWRVGDRQLIASLILFGDGGGWLAMKPDGHLDGSADASDKLRWRRSPNIFDITSGETYYKQFHSPHLLANIFPAGME